VRIRGRIVAPAFSFTHPDSHAHRNTDSDTDCNTHADSHAHRNTDSDADCNTHADADTSFRSL
jgi:hypothetical protein